jgi:hypothetical protein
MSLRVIYQNLADTATITASSTASGATPTTNLKVDKKSLVWRSVGKALETLTVNLATQSIVGGVALPFCNLSATATIRVRGYSAANGTGTLIFDTDTILACPYQPLGLWAWGAIPLGLNTYAYGGSTYARAWLPNNEQLACVSLLIDLSDTANTSSYIEVSRLVVGHYWMPKYNTSFGLSTNVKDLSTHDRSEAGDLVTTRGTSHTSMNFDLKYMDTSDRLEFSKIIKGSGLPKPLFISLFPNDPDSGKEQAHQIYGKLSQLGGISHPIFEMYSTTIDIEEV